MKFLNALVPLFVRKRVAEKTMLAKHDNDGIFRQR